MTQPVVPPSDLFPKDWYQSKTFWWNFLLALYAIGALFSANAQVLGLPSRTPIWLMIAGGIVNIVLRIFFTAQPINGTPMAAKVRQALRVSMLSPAALIVLLLAVLLLLSFI